MKWKNINYANWLKKKPKYINNPERYWNNQLEIIENITENIPIIKEQKKKRNNLNKNVNRADYEEDHEPLLREVTEDRV